MEKRFYEFLTETYKNFQGGDHADKEKYVDQVWDMLQAAYAKVGGIHGNGFGSKEDMIRMIPFWKLAVRGDKVTALAMYKMKDGRKRVAIATDGTASGKKDLMDILKNDLTSGRSYGEVSGPSLAFISKNFGESELKKYFVPVDVVKRVLWDDEIRAVDNFMYERKIGGEWHEKVMIGNASLSKYYKK